MQLREEEALGALGYPPPAQTAATAVPPMATTYASNYKKEYGFTQADNSFGQNNSMNV